LLQNFGDAARLIAEARPDGPPVTMETVLRQVNWERLEHQLTVGEPLTEELPFEPGGGATVWLRNTVNIAERTPDAIDVVCYMREITRERELVLGGQHAARLLTMGEMASGMAHELFQPLASISFAAEAAQLLLRRSTVDPTGSFVAWNERRNSSITCAFSPATSVVRRRRSPGPRFFR
jgi:C4-dicarboxylate-specific signal transduction histidine kinase